ncbi:uncharacterized protein STEHIDRAFT_118812 [Stereum hirsutum FP-91666 SS1]|uniref:uncharacterized protein n=1 Tax=Stereum hirsutum (strain FP-91666) TaxID=721885 RepID=UPI000440A78C|nr:uncharacterized protein STEHIDRAFT_118812 [Stereum hirsutum FP-91666 SS1]EIM89675.1 hypothetical protein STEHIDRAFT_118812 [Stereum hirsutum FP-91666 SS1]
MPSLGSTTLLRGFKVSVATLDAFLAANGVDETYGDPPFYKDHPHNDAVSKLLYRKIAHAAASAGADADRFRLIIPAREGHNSSTVAYITFAWVTVYAHREIVLQDDLPTDPPRGFVQLREEILSFGNKVEEGATATDDGSKLPDEGNMGLYMVYTYDIQGEYTPQELRDRYVAPQYCDQCDAVFKDWQTAFAQKQKHRMEVHGYKGGMNPLPNA